MMAPRVDRPVARVFPARWSSLTRTARLVSETDRDLERHRNPFGHPRPEFLSLFKGQGAAARDDLGRQVSLPAAGV